MVSVSRPAKSRVGQVDARLGQAGADRVGVDVALGGLGQVVGGQVGRDVAVDDDAADRQSELLELVDRLDGLLDRQRLQQRDQVNGGLVGVQQLDHALGLRVHRAALGQVGHRLGDVEEAGDPAGRRGVDHDRVVDRAACPSSARTTISLILPVSSTSRRPGAMVVANSMAPIRRIARPAMPRL